MDAEMQEVEDGVLNYTYSASYPNLLECYDLVKEIGSGAQATVFLCRSKRGKKQFACKTISIENVEYTEPAEEIEIMQKFASSPGIILLHEVIIDDGYWHLIMELCECSLVELIMNRGRLCEKEAALLIRNLSLAIQDLHQNGIIHWLQSLSKFRDSEIGEKLLNGEDLAVSELEWPAGMVSEARSLVLVMLRPDPAERLAANIITPLDRLILRCM